MQETKQKETPRLLKSIEKAMMDEAYIQADLIAKKNHQVVGEKNDYYVTLEQLAIIIEGFYE